MPVRRVVADEAVNADEGRVAVERGPLVYAAEFVDNGGFVTNLILDDQAPLAAEWRPDLLNGVMTVSGTATALRMRNGSAAAEAGPLALIPYYAWAHRGKGEIGRLAGQTRGIARGRRRTHADLVVAGVELGGRQAHPGKGRAGSHEQGSTGNLLRVARRCRRGRRGRRDRVELCSALFLGGLTPSYGALVEAKRRLSIPVVFMARPRGGGSATRPSKWPPWSATPRWPWHTAPMASVFGILEDDGRVDIARTRRLRSLAGNREAVFHRAFDVRRPVPGA